MELMDFRQKSIKKEVFSATAVREAKEEICKEGPE